MSSDRLAASQDRLKGTPFAGPTPVPCDHDRELRRLRGQSALLNSLAWQMLGALGDRDPADTTPVSGNPKVLLDRLIAERDGFKLQATANVDYIKALLSERDDLKTTLRAATEELIRVNDELTEAHAERDGLKILFDDLLKERDALALDKAGMYKVIGDLQAEVARLRHQLPSPPVHELEILTEVGTPSGIRIEVKCPYPECRYEGSVHAPTAGLAHRMASALAASHEEEMEEEPDGEG